MKIVLKTLLPAAVLGLTLSACSLLPEQIDETKDWSASKLYTEAKTEMNGGDYETAIKYYEKLQARYPYGRYYQQAQVDIVYAYYKYDEPESAIAAADRFIKLYPNHPHVDYVYYLKGMVNFNKGKDLLAKYLPQDPTQRDPGAARQSFDDFAELVKRYPDSKYSNDATQRMLFLRNNIAAYEVHVASYYIKRGAYIAAANRAKYVLDNYQKTPAVPDALAVMIEAYDKLGMEQLSADARRVMKLNYPDHPLLKTSKN